MKSTTTHRRVNKLMKLLSCLSAIALLTTSLSLPVLAESRPSAPPTAETTAQPETAIAQRARRHLARKLRQPVKNITLVAITPTTWPDGCLGLGRPGQMCSQALVSGWKIELEDNEQGSWIYRSTQGGDRLVLENPSFLPVKDPLPKNVLYQLDTSGGIAGLQQQIQVMDDGRIMEKDLRQPSKPAVLLRKASKKQLQEFHNRLKSHNIHRYYGQDYKHQGADLFGHSLTTHQGSFSFQDQATVPTDVTAILSAWQQMIQG